MYAASRSLAGSLALCACVCVHVCVCVYDRRQRRDEARQNSEDASRKAAGAEGDNARGQQSAFQQPSDSARTERGFPSGAHDATPQGVAAARAGKREGMRAGKVLGKGEGRKGGEDDETRQPRSVAGGARKFRRREKLRVAKTAEGGGGGNEARERGRRQKRKESAGGSLRLKGGGGEWDTSSSLQEAGREDRKGGGGGKRAGGSGSARRDAKRFRTRNGSAGATNEEGRGLGRGGSEEWGEESRAHAEGEESESVMVFSSEATAEKIQHGLRRKQEAEDAVHAVFPLPPLLPR